MQKIVLHEFFRKKVYNQLVSNLQIHTKYNNNYFILNDELKLMKKSPYQLQLKHRATTDDIAG